MFSTDRQRDGDRELFHHHKKNQVTSKAQSVTGLKRFVGVYKGQKNAKEKSLKPVFFI